VGVVVWNHAGTLSKPLLIYDGKCGFCRIWIDYWKKLTGDEVDYAASQDVADQFPRISSQQFAEAVQLVRPDGSYVSGARAVFETLGREKAYESSRTFRFLSEGAYRFIASHRNLFYQLTRFTFGKQIETPRFFITQWIFLRLLAVIYIIAFGSLAVQILGLIGSHGVSPAHDYFARVANSFGPMRMLALPSIFWWDSSDGTLRGVALAGVVFAALALFGRMQRLCLVLCYVLYLSFSMAGQEFLTFQWDSLLLEAGFLAIFFGASASGVRTIAWLYRWLVFRLMFLSGYVKLGSHDPTWRGLSALDYHFHTQPLPDVISWYADKLPVPLLRGSTFAVLAIELAAPFLIFTPRRLRHAGAWAILALQLLIFLTGNYTFFNLLTAALTLYLFDDREFARVGRWVKSNVALPAAGKGARVGMALLTALLLTLGATRLLEIIEGAVPEPLNALGRMAAPFQISNTYGLFANMTTTRPEIVVEGSDDGENWQAYEFRYKPGNLHRAPRWVQPYQPRLDWQMWFAALGNYRQNPWFLGLCLRLLEGSNDVLALLEYNPFPHGPPKFIRAQVFDYTFTDFDTYKRTGEWWQRKPLGEYLPAIGLRSAQQ
jgi:hypothetical protein